MTLSSRRLSVSNFTVELLVCVRDEFTLVNVTRLGGYLHSESEHNLVLKCSRTFISYVLCILPSLSYVWTFLCMSWHSSCLTSTWPCYLKTALHYTDMSNLLVNLELHKAFRFWLTVRQVNGQTETCLRMTMNPSKTLKPTRMYPQSPSAITFSSISTANSPLKNTLLYSRICVSVAGCNQPNAAVGRLNQCIWVAQSPDI